MIKTILIILLILLAILLIVKIFLIIKLKSNNLYKMGGDENPVVLFIPGLGNGRESFNQDSVSSELSEKMQILKNSGIEKPVQKFARTISFDPPGINNDLPVPESIDEYCKYIHELNKCVTAPYIVAHSIGCVIANRYAELYPVKKMLFLDPTPDFLLQEMTKPDFYTKTGGKYDITRKYINMVAGTSQTPHPGTVVIYNYDDRDPRKDKYKQYITENYPNNIQLVNKSHFIHLIEPKLVIDEIEKMVN